MGVSKAHVTTKKLQVYKYKEVRDQLQIEVFRFSLRTSRKLSQFILFDFLQSESHGSISKMSFHRLRLGCSFLLVLLVLAVAMSKSIDVSEQQPFRKSDIVYSNSLQDDPPTEAELFKYLLTKELLNRQGNIFDWEQRQRKRSYWKQCAFNAVSCFGKK